MNRTSFHAYTPEIVLTGGLSPWLQNLVELSRLYETVILLYEDDFSDSVQAAWAELDRLNLKTRQIGQVLAGLEVHLFGMDDFLPDTTIELHIRESISDASHPNMRRVSYRSILNELSLISVRVR